VSEQASERADSGPRLSRPVRLSPAAGLSDEARRRSDLATAAARGSAGKDLVLGSDPDSLALLGVAEESTLQVDVLRWQGSVLRERGQTAEAEALYTRSLKLAQNLDYLAGQAHAVNVLGAISQRRGELQRAAQLFQAAQRMADGCGDNQLGGMIRQNRGIVADISGDLDAALGHYAESLRAFEAANDSRSMTLVLNNLGLLQVKTGRFTEARLSYDRALKLARERGDLLCEGVIEENAAELEMLRGDISAACESITRALEIAALRSDPLRRAAGLKLLGVSMRLSARPKDAIDPLTTALVLSREGEDALLSGEILYEIGLAHSCANDMVAAREAWNEALRLFERIGATLMVNRVRDALSG
jgi:tetratricopeptide (TPR) repeat protein